MAPTRNNRGKGHENGSVESAHGHLKRNLEQALVIRGSSNFESVEDYQHFIDAVVHRHNKRHQKQITEERQHLQVLPHHRTAACELMTVRVTTSYFNNDAPFTLIQPCPCGSLWSIQALFIPTVPKIKHHALLGSFFS